MKYEEIEKLSHQDFPVEFLCRFSGVSSSGFYSWKRRPESKRKLEDGVLKERILSMFKESNGTYGVPRLRRGLRNDGLSVSKDRVQRLMKELGISAKPKKKKKAPKTTIHKKGDRTAPRVFDNDEVKATKPNEVWASDITYIKTKKGFVYLLAIIDLFSRRVVGWSLRDHMEESLLTEAFIEALRNRDIGAIKIIFHSDQGSQYCATGFKERLGVLNFEQSMSRRGNCYDNAHVESFWGTLKTEIETKIFDDEAHARREIFDYIEGWYNTKRMHSSLGYVSPMQYEQSTGYAA